MGATSLPLAMPSRRLFAIPAPFASFLFFVDVAFSIAPRCLAASCVAPRLRFLTLSANSASVGEYDATGEG